MALRSLFCTEEAFTRTNLHYPLCITVVLRLVNGPDQVALREALAKLQARHLLLNIGIEERRGNYYFVPLPGPAPIPLAVVTRENDQTWREEAERALNTFFDMGGPLMRAVYLPADNKGGNGELILAFHHGFVDSRSLRLLLHELLGLCGGGLLPAQEFDRSQLPTLSLPAPRFADDFRGWALWRRLLPFLGRQILDELGFQRRGAGLPIPENSHNALIHFSLPVPQSRKLVAAIGRRGLSLNSVLGAALLLAVIKNCHSGRYGARFRAIAFADIRPYLENSPWDIYPGCFISMLRFTLPVARESSLVSVAGKLARQMYQAGRRGELQLFALLSKHLVSLALRLQRLRLANTALSFMGKLALEQRYGEIKLEGVQAYITNNRLGPEFSGFGKVLFGRIELDLTYMPAEIDVQTAQAIVEDIRTLLENFS